MTSTATLPTFALASVIAGCSPAPQAGTSGASDSPGASRATERSTPYTDVVEAATRVVRTAEAGRVQAALALALLDRAQLTGSFDDYAAADRALAGAGDTPPCLVAAQVHIALHRLPAAAAAVQACAYRLAGSAAERAELAGIAADIDFFEGRYGEALGGYRAALQLDESLAGLARLARYHAATGAPTEAAALLDRAERRYHGDSPRPLAWLAVQRGVLALDAGHRDEALAHYLRAQRLMPGWWLADEHVAEIHALRGELDEALARYTGIVERTGHPEYMDAVARILIQQDRRAEAAAWVARARAIHRQRLARLPEAFAGHAVEHLLAFEPLEADELLALAQRDLAARPGAEARLHLAQAYLRLGREAEARRALAPVLASPWRSAALHALAAQLSATTAKAGGS